MTNNTTEVLTNEQSEAARKRVAAFLDAYSILRGADQEKIHSINFTPLLVADLRALLTSPRAAADVEHKFKNFHRLLCERFDYTHDEIDWKRDQVSLIEHIAKKVAGPRAAAPKGWKLVPIEATREMADSGHLAYDEHGWSGFKKIWSAMLDAAPAAPVADKPAPTLILTGAQLLEALDFIAPDRSADQLESEVSFQHGNGHAGEGMYCWMTDYPDEGASLLDGSTVAAQAVAADGADTGIDTKAIAESLERMIVDWYADCERTRLDWKQMAGVIKLRLDRFLKRAAASPATADSNCTCGMKLGHARHCAAFDESMVRYEPFGEKTATADERAAFQAFYYSPARKTIDECAPIKGANYTGEADEEFAWQFWQAARASQAAAPANAREPLVLWKDGTGMLWDTYSHGKWMHRVVSPHGWDAHGVAQHLYGKGYAGHLEVRAVWSGNYAVPADAGEAVASIENPLTPYGMLVRALRIVAGTTLMEMATGMGVSPAFLSSLEFGRRPATYDNAAFASDFFSDNGVVDTLPALAHAVGLSQGAQGGKGGERG
ncbi:helix-turn-helix domain-containing protein [Burkholderia gladioli]|uniref:helix-turn-helix domain-containing protein n=1 Tax=Burkholderia gladioli TaxID=28095 RepID=UPI0016404B6D|nr:helix-turn-helix transcriptional regulator [Burkholderia gladioli]